MHKSAKRPLSDDAIALLRKAFREDLNLLQFPTPLIAPNSSASLVAISATAQAVHGAVPLPTTGSNAKSAKSAKALQTKRGVRAAGGKSRKGMHF